MNNLPLVSICIPAYNYVDLFERCLNSVISQSYKNIEIIVTDDSPHCNIENLISSKFKNYPINYFKNKNPKGSPENWNYSISKAKGSFIKIMHHDDWFRSDDALFKLIDAAVKTNSDIVFTNCVNIYPGSREKKHRIPKRFLSKWKSDRTLILVANLVGDPSVTLYKNNHDLRFDTNTKWFVDALFYYNLVNYCNFKVYHVDDFLINVTAGNHTQITNTEVTDALKYKEFEYILKINNLNSLVGAFTYYELAQKEKNVSNKYYKNYKILLLFPKWLLKVFKRVFLFI